MTESGSTPHYSRGTGYHAFRGPRPVAWGQRLFSDADWECSHLNFLIIYQKDIMGLHYYPSLTSYFSHALYKKTYNSQNSGISGGPGPVVGAAELTGGGGGGGGGRTLSQLFHTTHNVSFILFLLANSVAKC